MSADYVYCCLPLDSKRTIWVCVIGPILLMANSDPTLAKEAQTYAFGKRGLHSRSVGLGLVTAAKSLGCHSFTAHLIRQKGI